MYAACHGHSDTVLALVRECGANVRREDAYGWNAKMYAEAAGHVVLASLIESLMADPSSDIRVPVLIHNTDSKASKEPRAAASCDMRSGQLKTSPGTGKGCCANLKRKSGVRVISSHLPRKVSTPPALDELPPGPCAEGGGLWTIQEVSDRFSTDEEFPLT